MVKNLVVLPRTVNRDGKVVFLDPIHVDFLRHWDRTADGDRRFGHKEFRQVCRIAKRQPFAGDGYPVLCDRILRCRQHDCAKKGVVARVGLGVRFCLALCDGHSRYECCGGAQFC